MQLVKTRTKGKHMNSREAMYIQEYHGKGMLVTQQQPGDHNVLFDIIQTITPRDNHGLLHTLRQGTGNVQSNRRQYNLHSHM